MKIPLVIWNWANYFFGFIHLKNTLKLQSFKNIHKNERCFIIGNGPSLTISDLEKLKNEKTMMSNSIIKIFDDLTYLPTYYFSQDNIVLLNNIEKLNSMLGFTKFIRSHYAKKYHVKDATYFNIIQNPKKFSKNIACKVYSGQTVTYTMIQFAVYMGFKEIYLIGVDNNYGQKDSKVDQKSYFDKRLFNEKTNYHIPELDLNIIAFIKAKEFCELNGIKIYNATRGGKLEVFERKNFDEIKLILSNPF